MDFLILSRQESYTVNRILEEGKKRKLQGKVINPFSRSLIYSAKGQEIAGGKLVEPGAMGPIFYRTTSASFDDYAFSFAQALESMGGRFINPLETINLTKDKKVQLQLLAQHKIPCVPAFFFRGKWNEEHLQGMKNAFGQLGAQGEYIVKLERGNQGLGVNLIRGDDALAALMDTFWAMGDQRLFIGPYLWPAREYRVTLMAPEKIYCLERYSSSSQFRANYHNEGSAKLLSGSQRPTEIINLAKKVGELFPSAYLSLDILLYNGSPYILEVNSVPGVQQLEEVGKINFIGDLVDTVWNSLK